MIEDYSRDLLRSGIIELKSGNREAARRYIDRALYMSGDHDVMAEGWYWMSQLSDDPSEKRRALENCLAHDLRHARARRALAIVDGKLKTDEIIDPETFSETAAPAGEVLQAADAQRFMCPKCGGRMHFAPDGHSLVCDYCTRRQPVTRTTAGIAEKDFLLAMATARAHERPLTEQVLHCQGCGAEFILPPGQLSMTCPYCASPHVVSAERSADLIAPEGIIPHAFEQEHAAGLLGDWLQKQRAAGKEAPRRTDPPVRPPAVRGLYLPLWTFDLGGAIDYTGEVVEDRDVGFGRHAPQRVSVSDSYPVMLMRLPIPGSRKLSAPFIHLLPTYDLKAAQPYNPRYLADWPAELYDIPMAEASLDARSQGYAFLKRDLSIRLSPIRLTSTSSANLVIESFRLNLVPVWMAEVATEREPRLVLVNGQTGDVYGHLGPQRSGSGDLLSWLSDLIGER